MSSYLNSIGTTLVLSVSLFYAAFAQAAPPSPAEITVPAKLRQQLKSFEPSGMVYLEDLNRYLVSSDDTDKKETPLIFLMDQDGNVESTPLVISGIKQMTDIESISMDDDGTLYFLSSLSINKSGKNKFSRNILVQASRQGKKIEALNTVELRPLLIQAIQKSTLPQLVALRRNLIADLDVESSLVMNGHLYLGIKNPQPQAGCALILNAGSVSDIFSNQEITNLSIWQQINFSRISTEENVLSEIHLTGETLFLTTTSEAGNGALWKLDLPTDTLTLIQKFQGLKPEALAYRPSENDLMIVFDQGSDYAKFLNYPDIL